MTQPQSQTKQNGPSNLLPQCVVCACRDCSEPVAFEQLGPDVWEATFELRPAHAGHPGLVHGGVLATLLDGAMATCMHRKGLQTAVTAELAIRYHKPVSVGELARLRAEITEQRGPLYLLQAELRVDEDVRVSATSKFVNCPALRASPTEPA